jgi:hypothetical protein
MKNLQDIIEGLLDMDDEVADKAVNMVAAKKIVASAHKKQNFNFEGSVDCYGRELNIGDLVIGNFVGCTSIGIIIKISGPKCAVDFTGTQSIEDFKTKDGRIRCPIDCHNLIKIPSIKIAKEIIK